MGVLIVIIFVSVQIIAASPRNEITVPLTRIQSKVMPSNPKALSLKFSPNDMTLANFSNATRNSTQLNDSPAYKYQQDEQNYVPPPIWIPSSNTNIPRQHHTSTPLNESSMQISNIFEKETRTTIGQNKIPVNILEREIRPDVTYRNQADIQNYVPPPIFIPKLNTNTSPQQHTSPPLNESPVQISNIFEKEAKSTISQNKTPENVLDREIRPDVAYSNQPYIQNYVSPPIWIPNSHTNTSPQQHTSSPINESPVKTSNIFAKEAKAIINQNKNPVNVLDREICPDVTYRNQPDIQNYVPPPIWIPQLNTIIPPQQHTSPPLNKSPVKTSNIFEKEEKTTIGHNKIPVNVLDREIRPDMAYRNQPDIQNYVSPPIWIPNSHTNTSPQQHTSSPINESPVKTSNIFAKEAKAIINQNKNPVNVLDKEICPDAALELNKCEHNNGILNNREDAYNLLSVTDRSYNGNRYKELAHSSVPTEINYLKHNNDFSIDSNNDINNSKTSTSQILENSNENKFKNANYNITSISSNSQDFIKNYSIGKPRNKQLDDIFMTFAGDNLYKDGITFTNNSFNVNSTANGKEFEPNKGPSTNLRKENLRSINEKFSKSEFETSPSYATHSIKKNKNYNNVMATETEISISKESNQTNQYIHNASNSNSSDKSTLERDKENLPSVYYDNEFKNDHDNDLLTNKKRSHKPNYCTEENIKRNKVPYAPSSLNEIYKYYNTPLILPSHQDLETSTIKRVAAVSDIKESNKFSYMDPNTMKNGKKYDRPFPTSYTEQYKLKDASIKYDANVISPKIKALDVNSNTEIDKKSNISVPDNAPVTVQPIKIRNDNKNVKIIPSYQQNQENVKSQSSPLTWPTSTYTIYNADIPTNIPYREPSKTSQNEEYSEVISKIPDIQNVISNTDYRNYQVLPVLNRMPYNVPKDSNFWGDNVYKPFSYNNLQPYKVCDPKLGYQNNFLSDTADFTSFLSNSLNNIASVLTTNLLSVIKTNISNRGSTKSNYGRSIVSQSDISPLIEPQMYLPPILPISLPEFSVMPPYLESSRYLYDPFSYLTPRESISPKVEYISSSTGKIRLEMEEKPKKPYISSITINVLPSVQTTSNDVLIVI